MITAKFSIQPISNGWAVRVESDVLIRFPTRRQAMLEADARATTIRQLGGRAIVVEEARGAVESVAVAPSEGNLSLQVTLSTMPDAPRSASKGTACPQWPMSEHQSFQRKTSREAARVGREGVGAGLRQTFEDLTRQPVPDQWLALLRQADDMQRMC